MAGKSGKYNHPSNGWKNLIPRTIYYYHVKPKARGYDVRVYVWVSRDKIKPGANLKKIIVDLTQNARAREERQNPRPIGFGFKDVPWWRRSYFVVAVEDQLLEHKRAIEITYDDGAHLSENHCFFDGWDEVLKVPDGDDISVMWTVNYMMDKSGQKLPPDVHNKFFLQFRPEGGRLTRRNEGDHGTNMGPPVPPP